MSDESISIEELTKKRTPSELMCWVKQKMEQIGATDEEEKALRLHEGLAKQLMEEVYPLAIFGWHKFGDTDRILLQPVIGSQNFDAIVTDLRTKPASQSYVEITQSHEGENDYLRRLVRQEQGFIFMPSDVTKTGTKKTGLKVSVKPNVNSGEIAENELNRIVDAAKRKAGKDYPTNTSLIIVFDDDRFFQRRIDNATLGAFSRKYILRLDLRFSMLYLVGRRENVFREFNLAKRSNVTKQ
jgi:hypothetical protein